MAEVIQKDGTWTFDSETVRIVPGHDRGVHRLRKLLGEIAVPLAAIGGIAYEPGRRGGRLRLRMRDGADPLTQAVGGRLPDAADPYRLAVAPDRTGVAEYFVDEVRNALLLEQIPDTPSDRYLLPGPAVPLSASGTDGTATFDGEHVRIDWNWMAEGSKSSGGPRKFALHELVGVDWTPAAGWENGSLRFRLTGSHPTLKPEHDPNCLLLWGIRQAKETGGSVLLAAALTARLPHPSKGEDADAQPRTLPSGGGAREGRGPALTKAPAPPDTDHDALLRRLRELGELHRAGVLTDEEFTAAKQAILDRF